MALRSANVLFIDDNDINLNEAHYFLPELMTMNASELPLFVQEIDKIEKDDREHKRLKQYRILETKAEAMQASVSNEDFLHHSEIWAFINHECKDQLDRIAELVERTNQLNYTKLRPSREDIARMLSSDEYECGLVDVKDKYGDYGTVGFYALHKQNHELLHFLFSCRTLGMRIEQWVYEQLNYPKLTKVGDVAAEVENCKIVTWVNALPTSEIPSPTHSFKEEHSISVSPKDFQILLKGPCDLSGILPYLGNQVQRCVTSEFNYVGHGGTIVSAFNCSTMIRSALHLSKELMDQIITDAPFLEEGAWHSELLNRQWNIVFQSLLSDCHEGVYRHRATGERITFSSACYNLCDPNQWDDFITGVRTNHNYKFTHQILQHFSDTFEYEGFMSADEVVANWLAIRQLMPKKTLLVLMLGGEIQPNAANDSPEFKGHAANHQRVNDAIRRAFGRVDNVRLIDYNTILKSSSDYTDCINHFQRAIYLQISQQMVDIINSMEQFSQFKVRGKVSLCMRRFAKRCYMEAKKIARPIIKIFIRKKSN